jgi:hypothetical protein
MQKAFQEYLEQEKTSVENINYNKLREWMSKANSNQLNTITRGIISKYFDTANT